MRASSGNAVEDPGVAGVPACGGAPIPAATVESFAVHADAEQAVGRVALVSPESAQGAVETVMAFAGLDVP